LSLRKDEELRGAVRRIALLNAVRHGGKAQVVPVVGKILGERPELRSRAKEVTILTTEVLSEINKLSQGEQKGIVKEKWPEALVKEKVEEEKMLPPLPHVETRGQVVTRFSPNPDCALHLGSARAIVLSHDYARIYEGKFILRFEDTDPKTKRPYLEFYDAIQQDLTWLDCRPDEEYIQSDRIPIYYEYTEKLLEEGHAYVCTCKSQSFREKILAGQPCDCRDLSPAKQLSRWKRMLSGQYAEGEAVVRVKTDLHHPNPAVRDWPALRVIDIEKYPHPRVGTKYRVWPLYNLAAGIDDHLLGVTYIIRGKEHLTNQVRQEFMYAYFGWNYPETIHYGRLKITGATLSKSKIVQGIRDGTYKSWDDPRLATFAALRRRGITAGAIRKMIIDIGPKTSDVILSWENLYAYNRKILDDSSSRYFFVPCPVELTVKDVPKQFSAKLHLHPEHPERGVRQYTMTPSGEDRSLKLWVSSRDVDGSGVGVVIRLMELFNVKVEEASVYAVEARFSSEAYEDAKKHRAQLIQWVPIGGDVPSEVVMPDASVLDGVCETACRKLKENDIVQFERFGFVRIDNINNKLTAYYAHK
jgi:glutamyl-tRNA synthetase